MKKLGIIRPCKIGDIIISLPIGKFYHDKGYEVLWPIASGYYNMFKEVAGHYINFIPILDSSLTAVKLADQELKRLKADDILNITFNVGSFNDQNSLKYKNSKLHFDEFIYELAGVPFKYKWNLDIKRNEEAEEKLFNKKIKNAKYAVGHFDVDYNKYGWEKGVQTRRGYYNLCKKYISNELVEIYPDKEYPSLFHWIKILENSEELFLVDSGPFNLAEGLNLKNKKTFLVKAGDEKGNPIFKNIHKII